MKTMKSLLPTLACISLNVAHAVPLTPEEFEVKKLAETMYSYDPATFEYGDFDPQLRPFTRKYPPTEAAKYNPAERCKLLKTMFVEAMLPVPSNKKTCYLPKAWIGRFPNVGDEDMSPDTRAGGPFKEKYTISKPVVKGNKAKIAVFTKGARNLLFLTKTDQGWRVSNAMVHSTWPDLNDHAHDCMYNFALPPSPEEKQEILPHCR